VVKHWNRLPRELVDVPSLETFKVGWGSEQPDLVKDVPAHCRGGWTGQPLKVPSNPNYSMIHLKTMFNDMPRLTSSSSNLAGLPPKFERNFQDLKGAYKKAGEGLFTRACRDRTWGNSFKLEEGRCTSDTRKKFFTVRVIRHWNRLPRETVDAPSLGSVQGQVG